MRTVAAWQELLAHVDATVAVTGELDDLTVAATEEWQRAARVKVTGRPDRATWAAAERALAYVESIRPVARPDVAEGDRGADVAYLQRRLVVHGHPVTIDGVFRPATRRAVAALQRAAGLDPSGRVDAATWTVLG